MIRVVGTFPGLGQLVEWYLDVPSFLHQRIPVAYTNGYDRELFDEFEIPGLREELDRCHEEIQDAEIGCQSRGGVMGMWATHYLTGPRSNPRCLPIGLVTRPMAPELEDFDTYSFNT